MGTKKNNALKWSIISVFVTLYVMTSVVSTIHVIDFFRLSNPEWLAITLAIAFEVGAAASLGAIIILDKTSRWMIWTLFILITGMQIMGNMYYAYVNLENFQGWIELFGLEDEDFIYQKRILSIVSGAILPVVALGFIKSLVDYIRPSPSNEYIEEIVKKEDEPSQIEDNSKDVSGELSSIEDVIEGIKESERDPHNVTKTKNIEEKIAKVISSNPELKDKLKEELKKLESGDKYTKNDSSISEVNTARRTYSGM